MRRYRGGEMVVMLEVPVDMLAVVWSVLESLMDMAYGHGVVFRRVGRGGAGVVVNAGHVVVRECVSHSDVGVSAGDGHVVACGWDFPVLLPLATFPVLVVSLFPTSRVGMRFCICGCDSAGLGFGGCAGSAPSSLSQVDLVSSGDPGDVHGHVVRRKNLSVPDHYVAWVASAARAGELFLELVYRGKGVYVRSCTVVVADDNLDCGVLGPCCL